MIYESLGVVFMTELKTLAECGSKWARNWSPELNRFTSSSQAWGLARKMHSQGPTFWELISFSFRDPHLNRSF